MTGVEFSSVRWLAKQMGSVPIELRRELRPRLRAAGKQLQDRVKSNASWSSRIPGATGMSVSFASKNGGVRVKVDQNRAPEARPLENRGRPGLFRHPVYGNREVWVSQQAHPFFLPAIEAEVDNVRAAVMAAVRASFPKGTP